MKYRLYINWKKRDDKKELNFIHIKKATNFIVAFFSLSKGE